VLSSLVDATDEGACERALEELVVARVRPLVSRILRRYRAGVLSEHDVEDLMSAIDMRVVRRLRQLAATPSSPIAVFDDYVATLTYNVVYDFLRSRYPERVRLKNRLRYLFTHDPAFALWETDQGTVCGIEEWRGRSATTDVAGVAMKMLARRRTGEAMRMLFERVDAPLLLDDVVNIAAEALTVAEPAPVTARDDHAHAPSTPESELIVQQELRSLWEGVQQLPPNQRTALLLNLRDGEGHNALGLVVILGIATVDDVADAIGIDVERLSQIWSDLPLDDLTIGGMVGVTRQQVVNLRKSARERLARMKAKRSKWRS